MVGRTLWADASLQWLKNEIDDATFVATVAQNFAMLVGAWQSRKVISNPSQKPSL
jgi:5-dehydro-2-deoxygluconokinase